MGTVQRGDRIVAVNGVQGCSQRILEEIRTNRKLKLTISRLADFRVELTKRSEMRLGLTLKICPHYLHVNGIYDGLVVEDWNQVKPTDREMRPHDGIVEVNGVTGDALQMMARLSEDAELSLLVRRMGPI